MAGLHLAADLKSGVALWLALVKEMWVEGASVTSGEEL